MLNLVPSLLGDTAQGDDLSLELATVRGEFMTVQRILDHYLHSANDMELEFLVAADDLQTLVAGITKVSEFMSGPHFHPPEHHDPTMIAGLIAALDERATELSFARPLTPNLPGAITYSFDEDDDATS